ADGSQSSKVGAQCPFFVEQSLRVITSQPFLQLLSVLWVGARLRERNLVRSPGSLDPLPVDDRRTCPPLGSTQNDHGPHWPLRGAVAGSRVLDRRDLVESLIKRGR